jgi:hypothetical protein
MVDWLKKASLDLRFDLNEMDQLVTSPRNTPATYWDSTGTLQSVAAFVPRNTYNPADLTLPPGLLAEEARTNFIRNNTMQGAVAGVPGTFPDFWMLGGSGFGGTVTTSYPTVNGIKCIDINFNGVATSNNARIFFDNVLPSASDGQLWTASVFASLVAGSYTELASLRVTSSGLTLDESGTSLLLTSSLKKFDRTRVLSGGFTSVQAVIRVSFTVGQSYNFTLRIGAPELSLGTISPISPPITTSGTAVTCAADSPVVSDMSWYSPAGGVFYLDYALPVTTASKGVVQLLSGPGNYIRMRYASGGQAQFAVQAGGVDHVNLAPGGFNAPGNYKRAVVFAQNRFQQAINGALPSAADTLGDLPSTVSVLQLGHEGGGVSNFNGVIRRFAFIRNAQISDGALQRLTRP